MKKFILLSFFLAFSFTCFSQALIDFNTLPGSLGNDSCMIYFGNRNRTWSGTKTSFRVPAPWLFKYIQDSLGLGSGTVTSIAVTGANGIGVSGSPVTGSGTVALSLGTISGATISGSSNTLSNIGNGSLTNSTISGVSLGANLYAHTNGFGITGSAYNGSAAQAWGIDTTKVPSLWKLNHSGFLTANQSITWTGSGDVSGSASGATSITPTLTLATTGVTAGNYTNTNLTVDAKGRITAASNGSGGGGGSLPFWDTTGNSYSSDTTTFLGSINPVGLSLVTNDTIRDSIDVYGNENFFPDDSFKVTFPDGSGINIQNEVLSNAFSINGMKLILTNTSTALQIIDGSQAAGYVFTSDINGNGSWQPSGNTLIQQVQLTGQSGTASPIIQYNLPDDNGTYTIGCVIDITSITSGTLSFNVNYTDIRGNNNTITVLPNGFSEVGASGDFVYPVVTVWAEGNTAITLSIVLTGVSATYDLNVNLYHLY